MTKLVDQKVNIVVLLLLLLLLFRTVHNYRAVKLCAKPNARYL
jgi:uncharacterized integral membrane protein